MLPISVSVSDTATLVNNLTKNKYHPLQRTVTILSRGPSLDDIKASFCLAVKMNWYLKFYERIGHFYEPGL